MEFFVLRARQKRSTTGRTRTDAFVEHTSCLSRAHVTRSNRTVFYRLHSLVMKGETDVN